MKKIMALAFFFAAMVQAQEPTASATPTTTPDFGPLINDAPNELSAEEEKELRKQYQEYLKSLEASPTATATASTVAASTDAPTATASPSAEPAKELPKVGAPSFKRPNSIASNTNPPKPAPVIEAPAPTPEAPKEFCSGEGEKIVTLNRGTKFEEVCLLANGKSVSKDKYGK